MKIIPMLHCTISNGVNCVPDFILAPFGGTSPETMENFHPNFRSWPKFLLGKKSLAGTVNNRFNTTLTLANRHRSTLSISPNKPQIL